MISADPQGITPVDAGRVFFSAVTGSGQRELHVSDGTATGTGLVKNLSGATSSNPSNLTAVGSRLFFTATTPFGDVELYKSDELTGTGLIKNLYGSGVDANPNNLTAVGDWLFFTATRPDGNVELHKSNGYWYDTLLVKDLVEQPVPIRTM